MRARIHRGAEIGGGCVELEAEGQRLVLDLALPLDAGLDHSVPLPDVPGLTRPDSSLVGVVVSDAHPDHYGMLDQVAEGTPVYMGWASEAILREAAFFGAATEIPKPAGHLEDGVALGLGRFRVTPVLVDHSAFGAYALLIDVDGRRLLYSGDLRAHGRKPGSFRRLLEHPPDDVHTLLLEGTRLSRATAPEDLQNETAVERRMIKVMKRAKGLVLVAYSAQNINRLVSVFRATLQADRDLVIDLYTAAVAEATGHAETVPQATWERVRVYVPQSQRIRVKRGEAFERVNRVMSKLGLRRRAARPGRQLRAELPDIDDPRGRTAQPRRSRGHLVHVARLPRRPRPCRAPVVPQPSRHDPHRDPRLRSCHDRGSTRPGPGDRPGPCRPDPRCGAGALPALYDRIEPHANGEWWEV